MNARLIVCSVAMGLFSVGCSDDPTPVTDAGTTTDTPVVTDQGAADAGPADAGPADAGPADPWFCLGRVPPVVPGGTMVAITAVAVNASTMTPMVGVTVKACARADLTCATPHSMGTTDAMGRAMLTGPVGAQGFDGYLELSGGTGANETVPTRMFPNPALAAGAQTVNVRLVARETFLLLGAVLMAQLNATNGMITAGAGNCNRAPAAGVTFSATPMPAGARQFYTNAGGIPSAMEMQTTEAGSGGWVNVPPGDYTITSTRVSPMARVGSAAISVRGGYITSVNVGPSP